MSDLVVPPNEIIKTFGDFRVVKVSWRSSIKPFELYNYLRLERRYKNLAGEAYYSIAVDYPDDHGRCIEQQQAYDLLSQTRQLVDDLLKEIVK